MKSVVEELSNCRIVLNVFGVTLTTRTCFIAIFVAASRFTDTSLAHSFNIAR